MSALINREIMYNTPIEFIEHLTGKKVKSYKRFLDRNTKIIIFTDNTCIELNDYELIDRKIVFKPIPKSFCACCGEESHIGYFDWNGRCEIYLKNWWKKIRKIYWHRYIKNKK
jgi:hypothetical protein